MKPSKPAEPDPTPSATLARKLEWLIQNMWPADAPPARNNVETAAAIANSTGEDISSTTVWKLRTGRQDNPQLKTLTALAVFFDVPLGYFGFPVESAPLEDDLIFKALRCEVERGVIRPDVLRALLDMSSEVRCIVDEMILAAAAAAAAAAADVGAQKIAAPPVVGEPNETWVDG